MELNRVAGIACFLHISLAMGLLTRKPRGVIVDVVRVVLSVVQLIGTLWLGYPQTVMTNLVVSIVLLYLSIACLKQAIVSPEDMSSNGVVENNFSLATRIVVKIVLFTCLYVIAFAVEVKNAFIAPIAMFVLFTFKVVIGANIRSWLLSSIWGFITSFILLAYCYTMVAMYC